VLLRKPTTGIAGCCARAASGHAVAPPSSVMNSRRFIFALIQSPRRRAAEIDVDNSMPNHLNIHVLERDYDIKPRFSAFIGFVLHGYPHNDLRIFCARLRPFALNNFRLFDLSKQALHEYPS
jgi:hypothetical protein